MEEVRDGGRSHGQVEHGEFTEGDKGSPGQEV